MNWTITSTEGGPVQKEGESDTIPCLAVRHNQVVILCWNVFYQCWDDEDGDDNVCEPEGVKCWIRLNELPPIPS